MSLNFHCLTIHINGDPLQMKYINILSRIIFFFRDLIIKKDKNQTKKKLQEAYFVKLFYKLYAQFYLN